MKREGIVQSWNGEYGVITIRLSGGRIERIFFHESRVDICVPLEPYRGCKVLFNVSEKEVKPGKMPYGLDVEIYESDENIMALERKEDAALE